MVTRKKDRSLCEINEKQQLLRPDLESLTDRNGEAEPPKCSMRNLWEITDGAFSALTVFFFFFYSSLIVWAVCAFTASPLVHCAQQWRTSAEGERRVEGLSLV